MRKIYLSFVVFSIFGFWNKQINAQEQPHYSLYMLRPTLYNPAAFASYDMVNASMLFNAQMVGFKGFPLVGAADVGIPIGKTGFAVGVTVGQDKIGAVYKGTFGASFAYRIKLNYRHYLAFGLNAVAEMTQGNFTNLVVQDPNDPIIGQFTNTFWNPNFKIGSYYFTQNAYVGFSVGNVISLRTEQGSFTPTMTSRIEDIHFYLQGGWQHKLGENWKLQPSLLFKKIAGSPLQIDVNAQMLFRDAFGFGFSYRTLNTLVLQTNYTIKNMLTIAYAFNLGLGFSDRTQYTGHEVMLIFRSPKSKFRIPVSCPRF